MAKKYHCDFCYKLIKRSKVIFIPAETIKDAVRKGFNFHSSKYIDNPSGKAIDDAFFSILKDIGEADAISKVDYRRIQCQDWKKMAMKDTTDWGLCPSCVEAFWREKAELDSNGKKAFHNTKKMSTENVPKKHIPKTKFIEEGIAFIKSGQDFQFVQPKSNDIKAFANATGLMARAMHSGYEPITESKGDHVVVTYKKVSANGEGHIGTRALLLGWFYGLLCVVGVGFIRLPWILYQISLILFPVIWICVIYFHSKKRANYQWKFTGRHAVLLLINIIGTIFFILAMWCNINLNHFIDLYRNAVS